VAHSTANNMIIKYATIPPTYQLVFEKRLPKNSKTFAPEWGHLIMCRMDDEVFSTGR